MDFEHLKLSNQLCFPVYAASRLIIREYKPYLDQLGITYPQYLVLMVLWETDEISVNEITQKLILNTNTVTPLLLSVLKTLMAAKEFDPFRLIGGTALSLYRGHRKSVDIDLFSDAPYDSIDFGAIDSFLRKTYTYVDTNEYKVVGMGKSYYIGETKDNCVKLDLFYTDEFIQEIQLIDGIRLATVEEIIAMKINIISRGGNRK